MKTIHFALAALSLAAASVTHASEAFQFEIPMTSSVTRAEVLAEARRASAAGELRTDEAYPRFSATPASNLSRAQVRTEAVMALGDRSYGDKSTNASFIGGM